MLRAVLAACTGLVAIAALLAVDLDAGGNLAAPAAGVRPRAATVPEMPPGDSAAAVAEPRTTGAVRNVTPAGMTGPAAIPPPSHAGTAGSDGSPPPAPPPSPALTPGKARTERLFKPVVAAAGLLALGERRIRLAGVDAPDPDASCGEGARAWPCGRMARAALRRFLRGRAVECQIPAGADRVPDAAHCNVAGANLAEWLARQGWAIRVDADYAAIHAQAQAAGRGLWSEGRPDGPPQPVIGGIPSASTVSAPDNDRAIRARVSETP